MPVKLSEIYEKYHENLTISRADYQKRIELLADKLLTEWDVCLSQSLFSCKPYFDTTSTRVDIARHLRDFFQTSEIRIPFVAVDGSSHKEQGDRFTSIYGGAYCVRGELDVHGTESRVTYSRHLEKDVSYVAFIPIPPEASSALTEDSGLENSAFLPTSDRDTFELSSMHNKVMQLAEVYAAYDLSRSELEPPKLVLLDTSLSSWLGNTSFVGLYETLVNKEFDGIKIELSDIYSTIARPLNKKLGVPAVSTWLPHYRLIAEAVWAKKTEFTTSELVERLGSEEIVRRGLHALQRENLASTTDSALRLSWDPKASWDKMEVVFNRVCKKMFGDKDWRGLICKDRNGQEVYLTPRELQFIGGIGLRLLIERCWDRNILLVGIAKDSTSSYFFKNYLGTAHVERKLDPRLHLTTAISDRTILELLGELESAQLQLPWASVEFDSAFMTILPWYAEGAWRAGGYHFQDGQEYTRPVRLFVRSLVRFPAGKAATHVVFSDRLVYPGWDDIDSKDIPLEQLGSRLGPIKPLRYNGNKPPRMQLASLFLLSKLIRNLYPEALGYPDPLHRADLGAASFRERVKDVLRSSWLLERSNPLSHTFRAIREKLRR